MKKKLLLPVLAVSLMGLIALPSQAATTSANATFTGTLSGAVSIVPTNGTGTIDAAGALTVTTAPGYAVKTNDKRTNGIFESAYEATPNMSANGTDGWIALTNGAGLTAEVANALLPGASPALNSDVIAYKVTVKAGAQPQFIWNATGQGSLRGAITNVSMGPLPAMPIPVVVTLSDLKPGTYSDTTDSSGSYSATMTLTATTTL